MSFRCHCHARFGCGFHHAGWAGSVAMPSVMCMPSTPAQRNVYAKGDGLVSARLTTCMSVAILDQASKQFCRLHASPSHEGRDCCESRCDRVWEEVQLGALAPQAEQMEVKRIVDARHLYGLPGVVGNLRRHISTRSADVS